MRNPLLRAVARTITGAHLAHVCDGQAISVNGEVTEGERIVRREDGILLVGSSAPIHEGSIRDVGFYGDTIESVIGR